MKNRCIATVSAVSFWRLITSGVEMNRDDDYLRKLLFEMADHKWWVFPNALGGGDSDDELKRYYHVLLLVDGGLMAVADDEGKMVRITNSGHDFIAMLRDDDTWGKVKKAGAHLGGASVQMLYRIAEAYARKKLAAMGLPLD